MLSKSFFILILGFFYILIGSGIGKISRKLDKLERKINLLMEDSNITSDLVISTDLKLELLGLIRSSQRVAAIKRLREETGVDLLEAKNYIDSLDESTR